MTSAVPAKAMEMGRSAHWPSGIFVDVVDEDYCPDAVEGGPSTMPSIPTSVIMEIIYLETSALFAARLSGRPSSSGYMDDVTRPSAALPELVNALRAEP